MNWDLIENKYSRAFWAFMKWVSKNYAHPSPEWLEPALPNAGKFHVLPFEMQSGVLEKFFAERGMCIYIAHTGFTPERCFWSIEQAGEYTVTGDAPNASRPEAQQAAYERAFEILESKLQ
jgi:hypothetical protein